MSAKTNYNDPTIASDPPGGKHHETQKEGKRLPTERPANSGGKTKAVEADKVAKAEK
ncbi:hypothetical protein [Hyphomicrobium sp.]|uniref:hypothetical protein n=1 Tax=Hyphomicrobium sp. TaxID=82 RepID=UPI0025BC7C49|nr:hypothetical protein [Hyphomicrobium sp.]